MPVPASVHDVLDTFYHLPPCPITGWDRTICGTYHDIRDAVNHRHGTMYSYADIGWALSWLHEHGPDECGATVNKNGPGNRRVTVVYDDPAEGSIEIDGSVYMLLVDGEEITNEQARIIKLGLIEWCDYRISSCRNDVIDIAMYRSTIPAATPPQQRLRRHLLAASRLLANEITVMQTMRTDLAATL